MSVFKVPDDVIEVARQYINSEHDMRWQLGDFLAEVTDELVPVFQNTDIKHPRSMMFNQIANATGVDASTLRDREAMARFFPKPVRERYAALTWSQMRACKAAGNHWEAYAQKALSELPAPVSIIRQWVKHDGHLPPAWAGRWERVQVLCDALMGDSEAPPGVRLAARLISMGIIGD